MLGVVPIQLMHHLEKRNNGAAANAEENAAAMETEDAVENATANEAVENAAANEASWYVFAPFVECSYPFVCICSLFSQWLIILWDP